MGDNTVNRILEWLDESDYRSFAQAPEDEELVSSTLEHFRQPSIHGPTQRRTPPLTFL